MGPVTSGSSYRKGSRPTLALGSTIRNSSRILVAAFSLLAELPAFPRGSHSRLPAPAVTLITRGGERKTRRRGVSAGEMGRSSRDHTPRSQPPERRGTKRGEPPLPTPLSQYPDSRQNQNHPCLLGKLPLQVGTVPPSGKSHHVHKSAPLGMRSS